MANPGELQPGDAAPPFALASDGGGEVRLSDFKGKRLVLYFYPKDDTSGCTRQALDFTALKPAFEAAGATIIGISKDDVATHDKFKAKHGLSIALAADPEGETLARYGVWVEKNMYGRKYMGIERTTFLIDGDGVIQKIWRKVKVPGHAEEILSAVNKN